jgi:creatinine amidohydrolase
LPLSEAGEGKQKRPSIAALREGWVWAPRPWTRVSADTGVGNPAAATPEKGARFLDAVAARIGSFLIELAAADLSKLYE